MFQHIDFVTAIGFHPKNDKFFISGSLDGKIRLWNIPDKKVNSVILIYIVIVDLDNLYNS